MIVFLRLLDLDSCNLLVLIVFSAAGTAGQRCTTLRRLIVLTENVWWIVFGVQVLAKSYGLSFRVVCGSNPYRSTGNL